MPAPTPWPMVFSAAFLSNISWSNPDWSGAVNGLVQYDYNLQAQRITHAKGATECTKFYHTSPCTLLTNKQGLYRFLPDPPPGQPPCCLDMPSIHTPPPTWAQKGKPTDAGLGRVEQRSGSAASAHIWEYPYTGHGGKCAPLNHTTPDSGCHSYYEVSEDAHIPPSDVGLPALFTFPAAEGRQDWYYDVKSMSTEALPASLFDVPASCVNLACPKSAPRGVRGLPGVAVA